MDIEKPIAHAFRFCPRCGTEADPVGEEPFRCEQCDFVFFFGPVTAVGGILRDPAGDVLLIRRAKDPGRGQYGLPGGFVDPAETAESALRREVQEEVGLEVERMEYLATLPNQYTYHGWTAAVLDVFFICDVRSFDAVALEPGEVAGHWIGMPGDAELENMAFQSNRLALLRYLRDLSAA